MGFGISSGNAYMNWQTPMMNNWNTGIDWSNAWNNQAFGNNTWGWGNSGWGNSAWSSPTSTSSSSSKKESAAEYEARIKKEIAEKNNKRSTLLAQRTELQTGLDQVTQQAAALNGTVKEDGSVEIKGAVQADGTIQEEKLENMSTGAKIMRGGMNLLKGIGNVCKSFVGFDSETGKWDPVKCIRNVGIAVAVGTLCVFAAPLGAAAAAALGSGAIATGVGAAIAATPTILGYAGVVTGAVMAGKGIYETAKADNLEEFDKGTQDIGAGAFIGLSSAAGLRSMSKAAGVAASSDGTVMGSMSAGLKNTFVNPWKASAQNYQWASARYTTARAFGASFRESIQLSKQAVAEGHASVAKNAFETQYQQLQTQIESRITEIESKMLTASPKEKALLELEADNLYGQLSKFSDNPTTKAQWRVFDKADKDYMSKVKGYKKQFGWFRNNEAEIGGQKFTSADRPMLQQTFKSIKATQKSIGNQMTALKGQRFSSMQAMARGGATGSNGAEVEQFGFSNKWYSGITNWAQSKYYGFTMPKSAFGKVMGLGNVALYATEPAWAAQSIVGNPSVTPLTGMYAYNPLREASECATSIVTADQYNQATAGLKAQEQQLRDALAQVNDQLAKLA